MRRYGLFGRTVVPSYLLYTENKHCEIHDRNYSSVGFVPTRQAIPTMTRHDTNSQA